MRCAMAGDTLRGLERGLLVLDALSVSSGLTLRELHRNTSLPKPTLLRIFWQRWKRTAMFVGVSPTAYGGAVRGARTKAR